MTHTTTAALLWLSLLLVTCAGAGCGAATGNPAATSSEAASDAPASPAALDPAPSEDSDAAVQAANTNVDDQDRADEQRAPAARVTGEIVEVTFDDLICNIQADVVFRPWMLTERAQELDGRRIRVAGFMLPHLKREGIAEFVLLRNTECKFGPGGQADHLIRVMLQDGVTTSYKGDRPLDVVGTLKINPFQGPDGNTWCIYDMTGESVVWKRR